MGIAKNIDPGQPAQSAQADHDRNFSLLADFLCINWPHDYQVSSLIPGSDRPLKDCSSAQTFIAHTCVVSIKVPIAAN